MCNRVYFPLRTLASVPVCEETRVRSCTIVWNWQQFENHGQSRELLRRCMAVKCPIHEVFFMINPSIPNVSGQAGEPPLPPIPLGYSSVKTSLPPRLVLVGHLTSLRFG